MNTDIRALQVGSYLWAKEVATRSASLELRLQELAVLVGKPYDVIKDQVAELARASRVDSLVIVSQLEYNHHLTQVHRMGELLDRPTRAADRHTFHLLGKPYHYAEVLGRLETRPGESPW